MTETEIVATDDQHRLENSWQPPVCIRCISLYSLCLYAPPSPNIFKVFADKFPYPGVLRGHLSRENIATPCKTKLPASSNLAVLKN